MKTVLSAAASAVDAALVVPVATVPPGKVASVVATVAVMAARRSAPARPVKVVSVPRAMVHREVPALRAIPTPARRAKP